MTTPDPRPDDGAHPLGFDGKAFEARAEAFGKEAEAAVQRLAANPAVEATVDVGARIWGLVLLGFGLWFFADLTLGLPMPAVAWRDVWPVALIAVGLVIVGRGLLQRR